MVRSVVPVIRVNSFRVLFVSVRSCLVGISLAALLRDLGGLPVRSVFRVPFFVGFVSSFRAETFRSVPRHIHPCTTTRKD